MTKQLTLTGYVLQESSLFYRPGYFIYNNLSKDYGSAFQWVLLSPKLSIRETEASCSQRSTSWVEDGIKWNGYKSIRVPQAGQDSVLFCEPYTVLSSTSNSCLGISTSNVAVACWSLNTLATEKEWVIWTPVLHQCSRAEIYSLGCSRTLLQPCGSGKPSHHTNHWCSLLLNLTSSCDWNSLSFTCNQRVKFDKVTSFTPYVTTMWAYLLWNNVLIYLSTGSSRNVWSFACMYIHCLTSAVIKLANVMFSP